MNVLFAKPVQNEIRRRKNREKIPIYQILDELEKMNPDELLKHRNVRRVSRGGGDDIFVLKIMGLCIFFTKKENDLVVMSIING